MRWVRPAIFLTGKTTPNDDEIYAWLRHIGCDEEIAQKYAYRSKHKTAGERMVELAGRRCYMSFVPGLNPNVTMIREDMFQYIDNLLASKHGSVLEHVWFNFSIEGISRVLTAELNRHGEGTAISEGSMRFILFTDIPFVETKMLQLTDDEQREVVRLAVDHPNKQKSLELAQQTLAVKKARTRDLFERSTRQDERNYAEFQEIWKDELAPESKFAMKKDITSLGRRGVPMGVATGGKWSFNIRSLRHILTMRGDEPAEEEILVLAGMLLERMMKEEPILFGDFRPNAKGYWRPKYEKV